MKFIVTCFDDDMRTRILASRSKVFASVPKAIMYANTIAAVRVPSVVPVPTDAEHAAEFIFDHIVEKRPDLVDDGDPELVKGELRYEIGGEGIMAVFAPGNEIASAFMKGDFPAFTDEIERLVLGSV